MVQKPFDTRPAGLENRDESPFPQSTQTSQDGAYILESLPGDVEVEGPDELGGDLVEDACGEVMVAEESLIAFEGAGAEGGAGFEVQGVRDLGSEDVDFDGLLSVPVEEVGEEDEARHG